MNPSAAADNILLDFLNVDDPSFSADQSNASWAFQSPVKVEDDAWNRILAGGEASTAGSLVMAIPDEDEGLNFGLANGGSCIPGGLSQISMASVSSRSSTPDELCATMPGALLQTPPPTITATTAASSSTLNPYTFEMSNFDTNAYTISPASVLNQSQSQSQVKSESQPSPSPKSSPSKSKSAATSSQQPPMHPCAISPHSTAALFTRASSVSSTTSSGGQAPATKKSRAPPSGPISTKDFIPPDVSGLNKREARLVKNRAAAFLSRQRKREEFEGLEARVEVLEQDNARPYRELEAYKSGGAPPRGTSSSNTATPATGALTAEIAGLKRQLASRDVELSNLHTRIRALVAAQEQFQADRERANERDEEIEELKRQLAAAQKTALVKKEVEDSDESDVEDAQNCGAKKDLKSAGSVAAMVLMFSLSTLLTNASKTSTTATPPKPTASSTVRRPMHHRSDSTSSRSFSASYFDPASSMMFDTTNPYAYDSMISGSSSLFFDEDSLMGGSSSSFGSAKTQTLEQEQNALLSKAISGVKSTGPNEFEFDFNVPSTSTSTSFNKEKKIKVCVKSAIPLNLDLGALKTSLGSTIPSPVKFQPDDDLDAPFPSSSTSGKRKRRVMVEINDSSRQVRRKRDEEERWDVSLREEMESDDDVLMA